MKRIAQTTVGHLIAYGISTYVGLKLIDKGFMDKAYERLTDKLAPKIYKLQQENAQKMWKQAVSASDASFNKPRPFPFAPPIPGDDRPAA